jgi:hypothetical protein
MARQGSGFLQKIRGWKGGIGMDVLERYGFLGASSKTRRILCRPFFVCFCLLAVLPAANAGAQERRAVLARGNAWVTGIPGFSNNAFPAISGEYRLEFPAAAEEGEVSVWLCGEPLRFTEDAWQPWSGSGLSVVQRQEGEARLLGFSFSGGVNQGTWTAVFEFPRGIEAAGLDGESARALINAWLERFRYFLFFVQNPADVSLPAAFVF